MKEKKTMNYINYEHSKIAEGRGGGEFQIDFIYLYITDLFLLIFLLYYVCICFVFFAAVL